MKFTSSLLMGRLIQRYKRFMADILLENGVHITAHCANPGAMTGLLQPTTRVGVSEVPSDKIRVLRYTWEIAEEENQWVGVNTSLPNRLVYAALQEKKIKEFPQILSLKEVKYGNSRIDFLLHLPEDRLCYLEVKNVHWKRGNEAWFPDATTVRGTKHLTELIHVKQAGHRAVMLYIIQRQDCQALRFAADIDLVYAAQAVQAYQQGVEFLAYVCQVDQFGIVLKDSIPIIF